MSLRLVNADLAGAGLHRVLIENCDVTGASLADTLFTTSTILYSSFRRAAMQRAVLMWSHIVGSDFSEVLLENTVLTYSIFDRTDLNHASLRGADLTSASFLDSDLVATDFSKARFGWTTMTSINLVASQGLELAQHVGPSTLAIETLMQRHGLPDSFLRGVGLPEPAIGHIGQLRPQDFHSCFISYSSRDQIFADFLYGHLQENKVLCWLATEDLKIGDQFRRKIEESILRHDKLLLILSHDSVESPWVRSEVETAFEKEHRTGLSVLFPIRLDDTVMQSTQDWAAEIRRTRHIGDFRSWQDSEFYRKAFARLLRDLKGRADVEAPT